MGVLWIGNEIDTYIPNGTNAFEEAGANDAGQREGMRLNRSDGSTLTSTPDWAACNEIWHRYTMSPGNGFTVGRDLWKVMDASGLVLARLITTTATAAEFRIWNGATYTVLGTISLPGGKGYYHIHMKGGAAGAVEIYAGNVGTISQLLSVTGAYGSVINMVRVYHEGPLVGGGYNTNVAQEIVQTTSTLNTTFEVKPPNVIGTDVDGTGAIANVNEAANNDATYDNLSATGQHRSYKGAARTLTQPSVFGVTVTGRLWYEPGGPTSAKPYLTIGGVRYYGTTFALALTAAGYQYTWAVDPSTGVAFTAAVANAATLEWGWEAV